MKDGKFLAILVGLFFWVEVYLKNSEPEMSRWQNKAISHCLVNPEGYSEAIPYIYILFVLIYYQWLPQFANHV